MPSALERTTQRTFPNLVQFCNETDTETAALAAEFGISGPFMSQIKWNTREPKLALALKIAARCRVPLESLIVAKRRRAR